MNSFPEIKDHFGERDSEFFFSRDQDFFCLFLSCHEVLSYCHICAFFVIIIIVDAEAAWIYQKLSWSKKKCREFAAVIVFEASS